MSKILSIAPYKYLKPQNGGHWGIFFVDSLLAKNNDVVTLSVQGNEPFSTPFTQNNSLSNGKLRYLPFGAYKAIYQAALAHNADYIFCHHHYLFPAAYKAAKRLNIPIYIRSHNIESERFRSMGKWWWKQMKQFEKYAYSKANKTFFISDEDRDWALHHFHLTQEQVAVMPFATPFQQIPQSPKSRQEVAELHQLDPKKPWFIFMGILSYYPNEEAVALIVNELLPYLNKDIADFEIVICGKGLNPSIVDKIRELSSVHYLGFVEDLEALLFHSHIMLNPVLNGGGVKTKVIEALAWNLYVVSTHFGAFGISKSVCGNKLATVNNTDWQAFSTEVAQLSVMEKENIPQQFFEHFNTESIAQRMQPYFS